MSDFGNQFKHVSRRLMRSPMFTVVTLVTIALVGIVLYGLVVLAERRLVKPR